MLAGITACSLQLPTTRVRLHCRGLPLICSHRLCFPGATPNQLAELSILHLSLLLSSRFGLQ